MVIYHLFAVVLTTSGQVAYDNWTYSTLDLCEKNRAHVVLQLKEDERTKDYHVSQCDKLVIGGNT